MKIFKLLGVFVFIALLSGCAAFSGNDVVDAENAQTAAGITDVNVKFCPIGPENAPDDFKICGASWRDGKEKQNVALTLDLPSFGKLSYSAADVKGAQLVKLRADVEKAFVKAGVEQTEAVKNVIPELVELLKPFIGAP